jgi:tyrosyl-tRNA synthetase
VEFLDELEARGLIHQIAEHAETPLRKLLETPQTVYAGFDPTAPSMHVGNLIPLLGLKRFQEAGHKVIVLAGGATGMVGDPSGKSAERNLQTEEALDQNLQGIKGQMERILDFSGERAILVDNLDWTRDITFLEFLREIGKHFTINTMLRKDSVKGRLEREGEGISYTEFSYMLLQGFDFFHLFKEHDCRIQIGGSDQWGNITAGTELVRRKLSKQAYGVTFPLLTNSDGSKFGKSAAGAVWLDPARTSPFAFRQFWFKTSDDDVIRNLKYFTFLPLDEIAELEKGVLSKSAPNVAQKRLAEVMTAMVHGPEEAAKVEKAISLLFDKNADLREMPAEYLADAFEGARVSELPKSAFDGDGIGWLDLVVAAIPDDKDANQPISKGKARKLIQQNSLALNGKKLGDVESVVNADALLHDTWIVIKKGKKHYFLIKAV